MRRLLTLAVLWNAIALLAQSPAHVQDAVGSTTTAGGSSSQAEAIYGTNTTAGVGHSQLCVVSIWQTSNGYPTFSISDTAGDSFAPRGFANNGAPGTRSIEAWEVNTNAGGANTVTVAVTAGPTGALDLHCSEWSGTASYAFEFMGQVSLINNQNPFTVPTIYAQTLTTTVVLYGYSQQASTVTYSATGYAAGAVASETSHGSSLGMLYAAQAATGSFSPQISGIGNGVDGVVGMALRSINPTFGPVEWGFVTSLGSSVSSLSCTLPATAPAGSLLHVKTWSGNYVDSIGGNAFTPQLTSNVGGQTFITIPNSIRNTSADGIVHFLHVNATGAENSFTVAAYGGGTQRYDAFCDVIVGVSTSFPLWQSTVGPLTSGTSTPTTTVQVPAGTYWVLSSFGDFNLETGTPTSGFNPVWQSQNAGANYLDQEWGEAVTISTTTSFSNTITTGSNTNQSYADIALFGVATNLGPRVIQVNNNGGSSGSTNTVTQSQVPVTVGNTVLIAAAWPGTGVTPSVTENLGNAVTLLCGGTSSDYYGIWKIAIMTGGIETVNVNPINVTAALAFEVGYTGAIDASVCNETAGTSVNSGNITTTDPQDYILAIGTWANPATCGTGGGLTFSGSQPPYIYRIGSTSHCGAAFSFDQYPHATGTFNSAWTTSVTGTNGAGIFAFKPTQLPSGLFLSPGTFLAPQTAAQP